MTDLEGRALDEALARAMGWKRYIGAEIPEEHRERGTQEQEQIVWIAPGNKREACSWCGYGVTEWHASLDALLRDIEPVCRERGMLRLNIEQSGENLWNAFAKMRSGMSQYEHGTVIEAAIATGMSQYEHGTGPTAATALARAFLAVLTRGER